MDIGGIPVVEVRGDLIPQPGDGEIARRIVRHGMAKYLKWLGEEVGPKPTDRVAGFLVANAVLYSDRESIQRIEDRLDSWVAASVATPSLLDAYRFGDPGV